MSGAAAPEVSAAESPVDADLNLADLIEQHENTDWNDVPGVSAAEAAAWTQRLIEARDRVQEGL